jgi:DUF971 family protein
MVSKVKPNGITLNKTENYLEISWEDGEVSQYPLSHLREACPCVECRGGHAFMGIEFATDNLLKLTPKRNYNMTEINAVGNYAICPVWDDGHATGIYSWEYLRHIAPKPLLNTD